ncbi:MAG: adenosylmethionine decarboxylase [Alphaproteobacteria bacterium]
MAVTSLAVKGRDHQVNPAPTSLIAHNTYIPGSEQPDHFMVDEEGKLFAGRHVIIDLWDVPGPLLADMELIKSALAEAAKTSGATLLNMDLHRFEPNGGISGVAVLAESHISIHTWPERGYAAIDAFMCGQAVPTRSIGVLERAFTPGKIDFYEIKRGVVADQND